MKPQKRLQVMQGGRLRPFFKGQILTYNETAGVYYFEHKGITKQSPFTAEQLESMHSSLVQPLSADGLLKSEIIKAWNKDESIIECFSSRWSDAPNLYYHIEGRLHLYRIKPKPKFIAVPEWVRLVSYSDLQPAILNRNRQLFIHKEDGLPIMMEHEFKGEPHQISLTSPKNLENGQIYFYKNGSKSHISNYYVYCEKDNTLYNFSGDGYCIEAYTPIIANLLKVTPK